MWQICRRTAFNVQHNFELIATYAHLLQLSPAGSTVRFEIFPPRLQASSVEAESMHQVYLERVDANPSSVLEILSQQLAAVKFEVCA